MMKRQYPTLAEVAKVAGVSLMTASRAINNRPGVSPEKREDILRIADEMGYVVNRAAQKLSGARTRIIGVVAELHTPFTSDLLLGMGAVARAANYEMLVYSLPDRDRRPPGSIIDLLRQIADGVIVILPYESDYLETMATAHVPVVTIEQGTASVFPSVTADNYQGGCAALQHLIELGHRRIGFITGNDRLTSARDRRRAYRDILAQARLPYDPALEVQGDFSRKSGFEAAKQLLALDERPTAIFAANDMSAYGAIAAIREAGLSVPGDISVVGFDDIPIAAQLHPQLTTIRQPLQQMARAAVNLLLALVAGLDAPSEQIVLPTQLIVRESTHAAKGRRKSDQPAHQPAAIASEQPR